MCITCSEALYSSPNGMPVNGLISKRRFDHIGTLGFSLGPQFGAYLMGVNANRSSFHLAGTLTS